MATALGFRRVLAAVTAFASGAGAQQQQQVFLNINPSWSPDGRTILFDSSRDGAFHLYTIRPDGTDERRLTTRDTSASLQFARHPTWSPNGRQIAFDSDRDGCDNVVRRGSRMGSGHPAPCLTSNVQGPRTA